MKLDRSLHTYFDCSGAMCWSFMSRLSLPSSLQRKRKAAVSPSESVPELPSEAATSSSGSDKDSERDSPPVEKKQKLSSSPPTSATSPPAAATAGGSSVTKPPLSSGAGGRERGRPKLAVAKGSGRLSGSSVSTVAKVVAGADGGDSFKAVADDPSTREAYKSLFNSGAKKRGRDQTSHWVTFFPYH